MLSVYPACFFKEENGYSVIFPDLNWLSTCGDTLEAALEAAVDCLAGYLFTCKREGTEFPAPSPMSSINLSSISNDLEIHASDAFINMVTVDAAEYAKAHFEKPVKKTLTIPSWLNVAALEQNINFSQVLQEALLNKIQHKA